MGIVRSIFAYDRAGWRPVGALLRFLGVALSAVGGEAMGGHGAAVLAGVGALYAGIASFGGVHRARLKRMLAAIAAATVCTYLGCVVEPSDVATVATVTLVALALGVFAEAGPDPAQVALLGTGTLVVFSGLHGARANPLGNAALVLFGGLGQAAILLLVHPISPVAAERRSVEAVYAGLEEYATGRAAGRGGSPLPPAGPPEEARRLLREAFGYGESPELRRLWSELELADALRGGLAGLDRVGAPAATWATLADWLARVGDAVGRGRPIERRLPEIAGNEAERPWIRRLARTVEAEGTGRLPTFAPTPMPWFGALRSVETLRRHALGHALRYAVALGVATAGYRLLRIDHGYWAPLSLAFSLKPDFAGTVTKGLGRIVGTVAGVTLATGFVAFAHPSAMGLTAAMLGAAWVAFALLSAFFVGYSTALAFYVVVSVTLAGASATTVGVERVTATVAGSLLALVTALAWPRWEAGKARIALAVAFAAQAEYADAVAGSRSAEKVAAARYAARAARLEAERLVASAAFEPRWSRKGQLAGADAALARLAGNAARIFAAHVAALDPDDAEPPDDLRPLAAEDRGVAADLMG